MRSVVVSEHLLCRDILEAVVRDDLNLAPVVVATELAEVAAGPWNLAVLDLPGGVEAGAWMALTPSARRRVLVAPEADPALEALAQNLGFDGVLPKTLSRAAIVRDLRKIIKGAPRPRSVELEDVAALLARMTPRQQEVATELRHGRTNKEIAQRLGISVATVKLHVQAILRATGARNRTEAVSRLMSRTA